MAGSPANSHGNGYPLALAGAVSATRFVGGTATVAPTTGTFAVGDFVISQNGKLWVCTVAGTPGTWVEAGGGATPTLAQVLAAGNDANALKIVNLANGAGAQDAAAFTQIGGRQLDVVTQATDVAFVGTSSGTAGALITGGSVTYDGSTKILVGFQAVVTAGANTALVEIWEDSTSLLAVVQIASAGLWGGLATAIRTPAAGAHTYTAKGWNPTAATGTLKAGGTYNQAFLITIKLAA